MISATEPTDPFEGQIWYDSATNSLNIHDGTVFQAIGGDVVDPGGGGGDAITLVLRYPPVAGADAELIYGLGADEAGELAYLRGIGTATNRLILNSAYLGNNSEGFSDGSTGAPRAGGSLTPHVVGLIALWEDSGQTPHRINLEVSTTEGAFMDETTSVRFTINISGTEHHYTLDQVSTPRTDVRRFHHNYTPLTPGRLLIGGRHEIGFRLSDDTDVNVHAGTEMAQILDSAEFAGERGSIDSTFSALEKQVEFNTAHGVRTLQGTVLDADDQRDIIGKNLLTGDLTVVHSETVHTSSDPAGTWDEQQIANLRVGGGDFILTAPTSAGIPGYQHSLQRFYISEELAGHPGTYHWATSTPERVLGPHRTELTDSLVWLGEFASDQEATEQVLQYGFDAGNAYFYFNSQHDNRSFYQFDNSTWIAPNSSAIIYVPGPARAHLSASAEVPYGNITGIPDFTALLDHQYDIGWAGTHDVGNHLVVGQIYSYDRDFRITEFRWQAEANSNEFDMRVRLGRFRNPSGNTWRFVEELASYTVTVPSSSNQHVLAFTAGRAPRGRAPHQQQLHRAVLRSAR